MSSFHHWLSILAAYSAPFCNAKLGYGARSDLGDSSSNPIHAAVDAHVPDETGRRAEHPNDVHAVTWCSFNDSRYCVTVSALIIYGADSHWQLLPVLVQIGQAGFHFWLRELCRARSSCCAFCGRCGSTDLGLTILGMRLRQRYRAERSYTRKKGWMRGQPFSDHKQGRLSVHLSISFNLLSFIDWELRIFWAVD